jgi:hypothetical protein
MSVERTYTIVSVTFNSVTYNAANIGGPLGLTFDHRGDTVLDRTADDIYSPAVIMPERNIMAGFRMRQLYLAEVPGATKSDLVFVLTADGRPTSNYTLTIHDMVLADLSSSLVRSIPGELALSFVHEHSSGTFSKV